MEEHKCSVDPEFEYLLETAWFDSHNGYFICSTSHNEFFKDNKASVHRVVVSVVLNRPLLSSEIVHHRDHNKLNCRKEKPNLKN